MTSEPRAIQRTVLPNGLVAITEPIAHVRSVAVGIWVTVGSRREPPELNGITHFIEHMVFKGTARRTAEEIAGAVDSVGGMLDAFTSKEMTCFNAKVLDEHLPLAFDVLSDLVLRPRFALEDVDKEKAVVLEELKMDEDNPDYLVHEMLTQNYWRNHPLGRPILGTRETIERFTRASVDSFFHSWYAPNNIVITAAGRLEHARLVELVEKAFGGLSPVPDGHRDSAPEPQAGIVMRHKRELEQVHLCLGVPSHPIAHEQRYAMAVLNNLLGGGMSSRLFQNIRERQGLAYAVFSELNPYRDAGLMTIYAGTALETAGRVVQSVIAEFRNLKERPITTEELRRAKDHLKGSLMLSLESTSARMSNLARQEIYFRRFFTPDEIIAAIEAVTAEEVQQLARQFFQPEQIGVTVLGNLDSFELSREALAC
jgi:predicted Zn-dependent peptidase